MYRTVVIPVAWNDPAEVVASVVDHGATLARQVGADVELMSVFPEHVDADKVSQHLHDVADGHGLDARLRLCAGDPAVTIAEVGSEPGSLLCMASHGRRPLAELALGSVSAEVVRTCRRPVVLVGPRCGPAPDAYRSLVVPLDGSELAETIVPVVIDWSRHVAVTPWFFQVLPARVPLEVGDSQSDLQEAAYVHRMADILGAEGVDAAWDVAHDRHPAAAIVAFAATREPALVALSTHGRSGLDRLVMGSIALEVTHQATCPVVVHRPSAPHLEESR